MTEWRSALHDASEDYELFDLLLSPYHSLHTGVNFAGLFRRSSVAATRSTFPDYSLYARDARPRGLQLMPTSFMDEDGEGTKKSPRRHVQVGARPTRAASPVFDNINRRAYRQHNSHHQHRQRETDAGTQEMIRFVRDYQLERQPTLLRLQRKAPLPGIGQIMNLSLQQRQDRGGSDVNDNVDYDINEQLLDEEVAAIAYGASEQLDHPEYLDHFDRVAGRTMRGNRHVSRSTSKACGETPYVTASQRIPIRPLDNHGHVGLRKGVKRHGLGRSLKQLPPIAREDLPDRPGAPSPSRTPPLSDELDSSGEPVDFIDAP